MSDMENNNNQYYILVIDDNPAIHEDFRKILQAKHPWGLPEMEKEEAILFGASEEEQGKISLPKFIIDSANQGEYGYHLVSQHIKEKHPYAVIFVDVRMPPGWDGVETISKIWEIDSDSQIVICTAYADYSWEDLFKRFGNTDRLLVLKKPFDNIEVRQLAISLTRKWSLAQQVHRQMDILQQTVAVKTAELRKSLSLLRATFESTADGILVNDMQNRIVDYNSKFIQQWHVPENIFKEKNFNALAEFMSEGLKNPISLLSRINEFNRDINRESFDVFKLKNEKILECYSQPQMLNETVIGRVWNFRDITEHKRMEEQLAYQATHDTLTGLSNRGLLLERIELNIQDIKKSEELLTVLFFDLDHFKLINDTLGHSIGDELLKAVAARLKQSAKPNDVVARIGGDEFVVAVSHIRQEKAIADIVERHILALSKPFNINGHIFNVTASVGVSIYPKDGDKAEVLFKNADAAMYRAKELGRNNFQFFTAGMNIKSARHLELSNDLKVALANDQLFLLYQPLIDVKTQRIIGVEALLRWNHPKRGLISPVEFIPIAEETGLIIPIGDWVLRTATKQIKAWHDAGIPDIWVGVNVSVSQFRQEKIIDSIQRALRESQLESKYLCLELTENILLQDTTECNAIIKQLKEIGVNLAIDDFGVGYSSLNYISRFPIDKLKIDRSFMRDVIDDPNDTAIVLAIIGIARSLQMKVLAEGVETRDQYKFLKENQCDEFQGFLVSKPVGVEEAEKLLRKKNVIIENNNNGNQKT